MLIFKPFQWIEKIAWLNVYALLFSWLFLSSCSSTNLAMSSAQAVYNRHTLKQEVNDHYTSMQAYQELYIRRHDFDNTHMTFATFNRTVLLLGEVSDKAQGYKAQKIIQQLPNVDEVYNLTTVASPSSSLTHLSDSWLTTKIKAKLIASEDTDASQIKVVTVNGTVYLMGILPKEQAYAAIDIARETEGVEKVVKIFKYITLNKA